MEKLVEDRVLLDKTKQNETSIDVTKASILPYQRHAIMCCGKNCGENISLFRYMKKRLAEEGLYTADSTTVRINKATCLGVCCEGPIMVVHPEGVWYCQMDEAAIERIIEQHFKADTVVDELCFHTANIAMIGAGKS